MKPLHTMAMFRHVDMLNGRLTFTLQTYNVSGRLWVNNFTASFSSSLNRLKRLQPIKSNWLTNWPLIFMPSLTVKIVNFWTLLPSNLD